MIALDPRAVALALGGNFDGRDSVLAPEPGHSSRDRSLAARLDPAVPDGVVVHSLAGDDWVVCRDHFRNASVFLSGSQATSSNGLFLHSTSKSGTRRQTPRSTKVRVYSARTNCCASPPPAASGMTARTPRGALGETCLRKWRRLEPRRTRRLRAALSSTLPMAQ